MNFNNYNKGEKKHKEKSGRKMNRELRKNRYGYLILEAVERVEGG